VITGLNNVSLARLLVSDIGIIFQNFNLLPTYTIYENIEVALVPKDMEHSKMRSVIMSTLEQFNLGDKANMLPSELSAGQQQKVAVVRTLVKNPSLILADEPTGSVDEETSDEIIEYLSNLKNNSKATVLLATHGGLKESIADRTIILDKGTII
jgi:putative ABC transport system ATP-binding protein